MGNDSYWWLFFLFQDLLLYENNIDLIDRFALRGLKTLHKLDISNNRLTSAPLLVSDVKFTLREFYLTRNYITQIKDSYFDLFRHIKYINIGYNKLTQFPSLENIANTISSFGVEGNNISNANFIHVNIFPKFVVLNLESNQIGEFCPPLGKFAPRLRTIFMQGNKLTWIKFPYESRRQEVRVFLKNNPWHCNGSLGWTQECEIQDRVHNIMVCMGWLFLRDMVCNSPVEVQGLTPKEVGNRIGKC